MSFNGGSTLHLKVLFLGFLMFALSLIVLRYVWIIERVAISIRDSMYV